MLPNFLFFMCGGASERSKRRLCTEWSGNVAANMDAMILDSIVEKKIK
jgi:hypothetical protein